MRFELTFLCTCIYFPALWAMPCLGRLAGSRLCRRAGLEPRAIRVKFVEEKWHWSRSVRLSAGCTVSPLTHNHLRLQSYSQQKNKRLKFGGLGTKATSLRKERTALSFRSLTFLLLKKMQFGRTAFCWSNDRRIAVQNSLTVWKKFPILSLGEGNVTVSYVMLLPKLRS